MRSGALSVITGLISYGSSALNQFAYYSSLIRALCDKFNMMSAEMKAEKTTFAAESSRQKAIQVVYIGSPERDKAPIYTARHAHQIGSGFIFTSNLLSKTPVSHPVPVIEEGASLSEGQGEYAFVQLGR
jgi:hypothetical protein